MWGTTTRGRTRGGWVITGTRYLENGAPVLVLCQWNGRRPARPPVPAGWIWDMPLIEARQCGPRTVLIERPDGSRVIRPFRGLRAIRPGRDGAPSLAPARSASPATINRS
jgi:hypothetical protein